MNVSFHRSTLMMVAALAASGSALAAGNSSAATVIREAPKRRLPFGFVRFAPMTADGMKQLRRSRGRALPLSRHLGRKGWLLAQLAAR